MPPARPAAPIRPVAPRRAFAIALLLCLALPAAGQDRAARTVSGEVTYRARIALPDRAQLVVEVHDAFGTLVADSRQDAAGAQVPLPFTVAVPETGPLRLRAGIVTGARPLWIGQPVTVTEGSDADLGQLTLDAARPAGFARQLRCGDETVTLGLVDGVARLRATGRSFDLRQVPAASGARYEAPADHPGTTGWTRGDRATVQIDGRSLPECRFALPPHPFPLTATGHEPAWHLRVAEGRLSYAPGPAADPAAGPLAAAMDAPLAGATEIPGGIRLDLADPDLHIAITETICRDTMTGMPHPYTVSLRTAGTGAETARTGCGGDPAALLVGTWRVTDLPGADGPDTAGITLGFGFTGRVAGDAGCNRFTGAYDTGGERLTLGPLAATRMACPTEKMAAERAMLDALAAADRFDIDDDGTLRLFGGDAPVLTARR